MASQVKSRWADDENDAAAENQRKKEKEARKKAKLERQRKAEDEEHRRMQAAAAETIDADSSRPSKRRRLSTEQEEARDGSSSAHLLRFSAADWGPCRHVDNFEKLNHIEEGSYGWVSRAKEAATGEVVALKKLKMDYSNDGFPVTGLREIRTLMASRHSNIVGLREVVMGDKLDE